MRGINITILVLFIFGAIGCTTDETPKKEADKIVKKTRINGSPTPPKGIKRPVVGKQ